MLLATTTSVDAARPAIAERKLAGQGDAGYLDGHTRGVVSWFPASAVCWQRGGMRRRRQEAVGSRRGKR